MEQQWHKVTLYYHAFSTHWVKADSEDDAYEIAKEDAMHSGPDEEEITDAEIRLATPEEVKIYGYSED